MSDFFGRTEDEWEQLRRELQIFVEERARLGRTTSYSEANATVARRTGLRLFDFDLSSERDAMGHLLGEISTESFREHGVMLSAIVIHLNENDAGDGFYKLAVRLGLLRAGATPRQRDAFWTDQVRQVHELYAPRRRTTVNAGR